MPSPIGHSLISVGASLFYKGEEKRFFRHWKFILFVILIGNLPDFDFIPGILMGNLSIFHSTYTHTIGFAVLVGFLVWAVSKIIHIKRPFGLALFSFILIILHLLADAFNYDSRPPLGVMLFWPITKKYFYMPLQIFFPFNRHDLGQFFSTGNLIATISELSVGLPLILVGYIWSSGKNWRKLLFGICAGVVIFIVFAYTAAVMIKMQKKSPNLNLYEAEDMPHQVGFAVDDKEADNGKAMYAEEKGYLLYGPYARFPSGEYMVSFRLRGQGRAVIDAVSDRGETILARKKIDVRSNYREFKLKFFLQEQRELEFRVKCMKNTKLWADRIDLEFYVWGEESDGEYLNELKGKVVFCSDLGGTMQIYCIDANGEDLVKLTDEPGENFYPRWGPDGRSVVFTSTRDGNEEIYVMDIEIKRQRRLTDNLADDKEPSWIYGTGQIIFCSNRDGADNFYIINSDGTGLVKIADFTSGRRGYPSSDGEKVVFNENTLLGCQIFSFDIKSKEINRLTSPPYGHCDANLSRDGTKIVFSSRLGMGDSSIWIMESDGENKECVVDYPAINYNPGLSPDNQNVVYYSEREGESNLYIANIKTKQSARLTYSNGHDGWPDWIFYAE